MMVQKFEWQMVADIVEMIFINHIRNFVQLNSGFLRLNFGFPTDVDNYNAFICSIWNENGGYWNVAGCSEQNRDRLQLRKINSINQVNKL